MLELTHAYRARNAARTVASLVDTGVPLLLAIDIAADAWCVDPASALGEWGVL